MGFLPLPVGEGRGEGLGFDRQTPRATQCFKLCPTPTRSVSEEKRRKPWALPRLRFGLVSSNTMQVETLSSPGPTPPSCCETPRVSQRAHGVKSGGCVAKLPPLSQHLFLKSQISNPSPTPGPRAAASSLPHNFKSNCQRPRRILAGPIRLNCIHNLSVRQVPGWGAVRPCRRAASRN